MELCHVTSNLDNVVDACFVRLIGAVINVACASKEGTLMYIDRLLTNISSTIFVRRNCEEFHCLSRQNSAMNAAPFKLCASSFENPVCFEVHYVYDLSHSDHTPSIELVCDTVRVHTNHRLATDIMLCTKLSISHGELYTLLCDAVRDYFIFYKNALMYLLKKKNRPPRALLMHHYQIGPLVVTIAYPSTVNAEAEYELRQNIHFGLGLPLNKPLMRRGQALLPVPLLKKWLGPSSALLVCPHNAVKGPHGNGDVFILQGRYTYKHYCQDSIDDSGWGCAYRSLQTLVSWLMWQGEIAPKALPSLLEIQASLVRAGDKAKSFIGSTQWIGSLEVSFCIKELYGIQCQLVPVARGSEMSRQAAPILAQHFSSGGGPVMVGGGQLAHTIIGVQVTHANPFTPLKSDQATARYLILDPHFKGPSGDLKTALHKGWCGWKEHNFWKQDVHYNLCLTPPIQPARV